jgi:hypothetical protein
MNRPTDHRDVQARGDELLGYFFPNRRPRDRVASGLRRAGEVVVVLLLVAASTMALRQVWGWLDAAWCAWRLDSMTGAVLSGEDVAQDLSIAHAAVTDHHPLLRHSEARAAWDERLQEVRRITQGGDSTWDLLRALGPAVASVGCGHTSLLPPEGWTNLMARGGRLLPLEIRFFGDRAIVTAHLADDVEVPLGAWVEAIDGRPIMGIREDLVRATPSDGPGTSLAEAMVDQAFFFHFARAFGPAERHRLRWRTDGMPRSEETEVRTRRGGEVGERYWRRYPERHPQHPPFPFHGRVLVESRVAYLWVPTFSLERASGWRETLYGFFEQLETSGAHTLVLDLRGNVGGPSPLAVELVEYLVSEPFVFFREAVESEFATLPVFRQFARVMMPHSDTAFRGELFVVVDGGTSSTAAHLCAVLREHRRLHFVGRPAGGGATSYDNPVIVDLPNSGLRLQVARTTFSVAADEAPIVPSLLINPSPADALAGQDTVLAELGDRLDVDLENARAHLARALAIGPAR